MSLDPKVIHPLVHLAINTPLQVKVGGALDGAEFLRTHPQLLDQLEIVLFEAGQVLGMPRQELAVVLEAVLPNLVQKFGTAAAVLAATQLEQGLPP